MKAGCCIGLIAIAVAFAAAGADPAPVDRQAWNVSSGTVRIQLDPDALRNAGLAGAFPETSILMEVAGSSALQVQTEQRMFSGFSSGQGQTLQTAGRVQLELGQTEPVAAGDFALEPIQDNGAAGWRIVDMLGSQREMFVVHTGSLEFDAPGHTLRVDGDVRLSEQFAHEFGLTAAGQPVGIFGMELTLSPSGNDPAPADPEFAGSGVPRTACQGVNGPDVIVGDVTGPANYTAVGNIEAFSIGTTSCNMGRTWLNWISSTNQHPVIGQNLYRLQTAGGATRFEQIGQSWLKHAFFALSQNLCCASCSATDGTHLGVGCSDPYTASRNGSQSGLGPKWQVNATTGNFTYPPANPAWSGSIARRLQVKVADLDPAQGGGGSYFAEGQYVTPDDAAAGNHHNNASYRPCTITGSGTNWSMALTGSTFREQSGINAWAANDPGVTLVPLAPPNENSRYVLGYKTTNLGGGVYHYEYALYNMNSDRSAGSFSVPIAAGLTPTSIGFHDVDYHDGDGPGNVNYDGTDWPSTLSGGSLTWATQSYAQNPSANALRWATLYNFRFNCASVPTTGTLTIGLFKPGTPASFTVNAAVPSPDCDANGVPDNQQPDADQDSVIDACDNCPNVANAGQADGDGDGVGTLCDNCPNDPNPGQEDSNGNGIGDACEPHRVPVRAIPQPI